MSSARHKNPDVDLCLRDIGKISHCWSAAALSMLGIFLERNVIQALDSAKNYTLSSGEGQGQFPLA